MGSVPVRRLLGTAAAALLPLAFLAPAALAAPAAPLPETLLRPAGPQARDLYHVLMFDVWAVSGLFLVVSAIAVYAILRARHRARLRAERAAAGDGNPQAAPLPPQTAGNRRLEVAWTLALIAGAVILLVHPVTAEFAFDRVPGASQALTVDVTGHQWWWEFRYPGQGIVTANQLHIPAGRVIRLDTTSADVIHAFAVPRLGGKDLAIPGRVTTVWIQADRPGIYQGQCEELCGTSHARMLFQVVAEPPAQFDAWVAAMQHPVIAPATPLARQGEHFFLTGPCQACHTIDGTSAHGTVGPNLTLLGDRTTLSGGLLQNTPRNLATWLHDPQAIKPGAIMPNLHLTQGQIDELVAFLEGMKR